MKIKGYVMEYNGEFGYIKADDSITYVLLNKEILTDEELQEGDKVTFVPERKILDDDLDDIYIARFVKKYK